MRSVAIIAAVLFSSLGFSTPQLIFKIIKVGEEMIIESAVKTDDAGYAIPLDDFIDKPVTEGFAAFNCLTQTIASLKNAFASAANDPFVYINPKDGLGYEAQFMRMIDEDRSFYVNISIVPSH